MRSRYPPVHLFEDIADPADWEAIASAEAKTNPRVADSIGNLDLVPPERRVSGNGASWVMAPFVHASADRPTRFSDGTFGVYYAGDRFEVALFETIYHHAKFMSSTEEEPGWTSDFRELVGSIDRDLHDIRSASSFEECLCPDDYTASNDLGRRLRKQSSDGIIYRSVRSEEGNCIAAFWPDAISIPIQGRHLSYYWSGNAVKYVKDVQKNEKIFSVVIN